MKRQPPEPIPLLLLTPEQACDALQIGRNQLEEWLRRPGFPVIRDGRVVRIPVEPLKLWLAEQAAKTNTSMPDMPLVARLPATSDANPVTRYRVRLPRTQRMRVNAKEDQ